MSIFANERLMNAANPVNRQHWLTRGLAHWWICLPGLMHGRYFPDLMGLPDNRFTVGNHGLRTTSGADDYTNAPYWSIGTNRPGGFGHIVSPAFTSPLSYLLCGDVMVAGSTNDFSWVANINVTTHLNSFDTIMVETGASGTYLTLVLDSSTHVLSFYAPPSSRLDGTTVIAAGTWYQVAATWTAAASNLLTLYVNGTKESSGTGFTGRAITAPVNPFTIGCDAANSRGLRGNIDDVRVYNRCLSVDEVKAIYQNSLTGYPDILNRVSPGVFPLPTAATTALFRRTFAQFGTRGGSRQIIR